MILLDFKNSNWYIIRYAYIFNTKTINKMFGRFQRVVPFYNEQSIPKNL